MLRIRVKNHHQIWILWLSTTWLQNSGVKLGHGGCPELRPASHQGNCCCASAHKPPQLPQDPGDRDMLRSPRHPPGCGTWLRAGFYTHLIQCVLSTEATCFAFMVGKPKGTEALQAMWKGEIHGHDQGQGCRRVVWNSRLQCQTGHKSRVPGSTTRHNIGFPLCLSPRSDLEGSQLKDLEGWLT